MGRPPPRKPALGRDDVVAVGRPVGRLGAVGGAFGDLSGVGAVQGHDPDVLAAAAVGGEDDPCPVGRKAGLGIERHAGRDPRGVPAGDRHREEIAQVVEDEGRAVGAHVQRDPRALGHVDREGAVGGEGEVFVLVRILGENREGGREDGGRKEGGGEEGAQGGRWVACRGGPLHRASPFRRWPGFAACTLSCARVWRMRAEESRAPGRTVICVVESVCGHREASRTAPRGSRHPQP